MKHATFLVAVLAMATPARAQDGQGDLLKVRGDLHGSVSVTWDSKFLWRGFDFYDDKSAVHLRTNLNLFDTGFGVSVAGHHAAASGLEDKERWDFTTYYQNSLFRCSSHYLI